MLSNDVLPPQNQKKDILCCQSDEEEEESSSSIPFLVPFGKGIGFSFACNNSRLSSTRSCSPNVIRRKTENVVDEQLAGEESKSEMMENDRERKSILLLQLEGLFHPDLITVCSSSSSLPSIAQYLLSHYFHIHSGSFRPRQAEVCFAVLQGRQTLAVCPTGWGKSLCYLFPMLVHRLMYQEVVREWKLCHEEMSTNEKIPSSIFSKFCIVVSPLISLMADQAQRISEYGTLQCIVLSSQLSKARERRIFDELESPHSTIDIIFVSPEKFIGETMLRKLLDRQPHRLAFICIDEVHCVSKWAFNFRPSYLCLHRLLSWTAPRGSSCPPARSVCDGKEETSVKFLCLTATASSDVIQDLQSLFKIEHTVECTDLFRTNLILESQRLVVSSHEVKYSVSSPINQGSSTPQTVKQLHDAIVSSIYELPKPLLVYVRSRNDASEIASMVMCTVEASKCVSTKEKKNEGSCASLSLSFPSCALREEDNGPPHRVFMKRKASKIHDRSRSLNGREENASLVIRGYHAGMAREVRQKMQHEFIAGRIDVLVATVAFGMGIDKSNIRSVLHAHAPSSLENYVQEIGRAGRDGEISYCRILYNPYDYYDLRCTVLSSYAAPSEIQNVVRMLCHSPCTQYGEKIILIPLETLALELDMHEDVVETIIYMLVLAFSTIFKGIRGFSPVGYKVIQFQTETSSKVSSTGYSRKKKVPRIRQASFSGITQILQQIQAEDEVFDLCQNRETIEHLVLAANTLRLSFEDLQFRLQDLEKSGAVSLRGLARAFVVAVQEDFEEHVKENNALQEEMWCSVYEEHEKKLFQQINGLSTLFEVLENPSHSLIDNVMRGSSGPFIRASRWTPPPPALSRIQAVSIVNEFVESNRIRLHSKYEAVRALLGIMPKSCIKTGKYAGQIPLSKAWYTKSPFFGALREFDFSWVLKAVSAADLPE